jgi:hypothetical protein
MIRDRGGIVCGGEPGRLVGMDAAMRLHFHQPDVAHRLRRTLDQAGGERALAEGLLGRGHPLVLLIATLLRSDCPPLRGVAAVELFVTGVTTPLYGHEAEPVRQELRRAHYLLSAKR